MDILIVAGAVGLLVFIIEGPLKAAQVPAEAPFYGTITAVIFFLLVGVGVGGIANLTSLGDVAEQEAFYRTTVQSYEVVAERTENIVITVPHVAITDFAQQGQAVAASERYKELRDRVEKYNAWLASNRAYNDIFFARDFVVSADEDLKPIVIEVA